MLLVNRSGVTIRDVAERSGVSIQTVSRVINNRPDVAEETRKRVQLAIADLRFRPSGIARSLVTRHSGALGVVAGGFQHYGPTRLLTGIEREASALGWHLLLQSFDQARSDDELERIGTTLISERVTGVLWVYPELSSDQEQAFYEQIAPHAPVFFLSMLPVTGTPVLSVDNRAGARMAVEHLIGRGRRNIGIITGETELWSAVERQAGWQDALSRAKLPCPASAVAHGDWTPASGDAGMRQLLKSNPELDAVFASNDQMAFGAMRAAMQLGKRVPQDLAIIGFDNTPESAVFTPALTTVQHDLVELGTLAVRELHRLVEAQRNGQDIPRPASLMLQPSLVVRESA